MISHSSFLKNQLSMIYYFRSCNMRTRVLIEPFSYGKTMPNFIKIGQSMTWNIEVLGISLLLFYLESWNDIGPSTFQTGYMYQIPLKWDKNCGKNLRTQKSTDTKSSECLDFTFSTLCLVVTQFKLKSRFIVWYSKFQIWRPISYSNYGHRKL